jgi:predicted nucleic acid-binding Zn ribbon protein
MLHLQVKNNVQGLKDEPIIRYNCDKCEDKETIISAVVSCVYCSEIPDTCKRFLNKLYGLMFQRLKDFCIYIS